MTPFISVVPKRQAVREIARISATKVLSIVDPDETPPKFNVPSVQFKFNDIGDDDRDERHGILPGSQHVVAIIKFARALDITDRVVIHCHAGVSRSPAAALIVLVARGVDPDRAFQALDSIVPGRLYEPNFRMIALADQVLGLAGQLSSHTRMAPPPIPLLSDFHW